MGKGFKSGAGGMVLNYRIVGGTEAPAGPRENTIWVNTAVRITGYVFSAEQPEAEEGLVWFRTGSASPGAFNALKRNVVMVYPGAAMQYVSGAWVPVTAKTYRDGTWVDWMLWLVRDGKAQQTITPTSMDTSGAGLGGGSAAVTESGDELKISYSAVSAASACVCFFPKMDLSAFGKLSLTGFYSGFQMAPEAYLGIWSSTAGTSPANNLLAKSGNLAASESTLTIDLTGLSLKECYVGICISGFMGGDMLISQLVAENDTGGTAAVVPEGTEVYSGPYEVTPTDQVQTLATAGKVLTKDITIQGVPQQYGVVTYDQSKTITIT